MLENTDFFIIVVYLKSLYTHLFCCLHLNLDSYSSICDVLFVVETSTTQDGFLFSFYDSSVTLP